MARKLDEVKRKKILDVARSAFGIFGYQNVSIKHIAGEAHIAQGSIYTYFSNKEDLFLAVVDNIWQEFMEGIQRIRLSRTAFYSKFIEFMDFGFDLLKRIHPLLRGMYSEANKRELFTERIEEFCEFVEKLFQEALSERGPNVREVSVEVMKFNINIIISGVLFRTSLVRPEELDTEIGKIKEGILKLLMERFFAGVVPDEAGI